MNEVEAISKEKEGIKTQLFGSQSFKVVVVVGEKEEKMITYSIIRHRDDWTVVDTQTHRLHGTHSFLIYFYRA